MDKQRHDKDDNVSDLPCAGSDYAEIFGIRDVRVLGFDFVDAFLDVGIILAVECIDEEGARCELEANHVP